MSNTPVADAPTRAAPAGRNPWLLLALLVALLVAVGTQLGVYTIQPIGAVPEGRTVIIWRGADEPFFNSADAECLRVQQSVSLLCRALALEWAYLLSTGGQSFDS